jgi:hypothetical protein
MLPRRYHIDVYKAVEAPRSGLNGVIDEEAFDTPLSPSARDLCANRGLEDFRAYSVQPVAKEG